MGPWRGREFGLVALVFAVTCLDFFACDRHDLHDHYGKKCYTTYKTIYNTIYETHFEKKCHTSYKEKCYTHYITSYKTKYVKKCKTHFHKKCYLDFKAIHKKLCKPYYQHKVSGTKPTRSRRQEKQFFSLATNRG